MQSEEVCKMQEMLWKGYKKKIAQGASKYSGAILSQYLPTC